MIVNLALMVLGTLAISVGAVIAVNGLHQDLSVATQGYRQLRQLYDVGFLVSKARESLTATPPRPGQAVAALRSALTMSNQRRETDSVDGAPLRWGNEQDRADCIRLLTTASTDPSPTSMNLLFAKMSKVSDDVRRRIADAQSAADQKRRLALQAVIGLCGSVMVIAIILGVTQYRSVIGPLRRIGTGVRGFAKGNFDSRIALAGDQEFISLSGNFNQMADELSALYRDLELKVRTKSQELVRSQQLASVGYLAAGVAHEINNPLGIIAGYGERAMRQLSADINEQTIAKTLKALEVICEEAFRCKQITDRLLSLAQPGTAQRQVVSLATVADEVIANLAGLGSPGDRSLSFNSETSADLTVRACAGELKQVILNLLINAIEAVDTKKGNVQIKVSRHGDEIGLAVVDNGQGMTAQTLEHVFEPFFSLKRGERTGTGLGLSIARAIVDDHGGQLVAASDGPGLGSTFTIRLPAAVKGSSVADS
jgi:signal transduction histidine kinase